MTDRERDYGSARWSGADGRNTGRDSGGMHVGSRGDNGAYGNREGNRGWSAPAAFSALYRRLPRETHSQSSESAPVDYSAAADMHTAAAPPAADRATAAAPPAPVSFRRVLTPQQMLGSAGLGSPSHIQRGFSPSPTHMRHPTVFPAYTGAPRALPSRTRTRGAGNAADDHARGPYRRLHPQQAPQQHTNRPHSGVSERTFAPQDLERIATNLHDIDRRLSDFRSRGAEAEAAVVRGRGQVRTRRGGGVANLEVVSAELQDIHNNLERLRASDPVVSPGGRSDWQDHHHHHTPRHHHHRRNPHHRPRQFAMVRDPPFSAHTPSAINHVLWPAAPVFQSTRSEGQRGGEYDPGMHDDDSVDALEHDAPWSTVSSAGTMSAGSEGDLPSAACVEGGGRGRGRSDAEGGRASEDVGWCDVDGSGVDGSPELAGGAPGAAAAMISVAVAAAVSSSTRGRRSGPAGSERHQQVTPPPGGVNDARGSTSRQSASPWRAMGVDADGGFSYTPSSTHYSSARMRGCATLNSTSRVHTEAAAKAVNAATPLTASPLPRPYPVVASDTPPTHTHTHTHARAHTPSSAPFTPIQMYTVPSTAAPVPLQPSFASSSSSSRGGVPVTSAAGVNVEWATSAWLPPSSPPSPYSASGDTYACSGVHSNHGHSSFAETQGTPSYTSHLHTPDTRPPPSTTRTHRPPHRDVRSYFNSQPPPHASSSSAASASSSDVGTHNGNTRPPSRRQRSVPRVASDLCLASTSVFVSGDGSSGRRLPVNISTDPASHTGAQEEGHISDDYVPPPAPRHLASRRFHRGATAGAQNRDQRIAAPATLDAMLAVELADAEFALATRHDAGLARGLQEMVDEEDAEAMMSSYAHSWAQSRRGSANLATPAAAAAAAATGDGGAGGLHGSRSTGSIGGGNRGGGGSGGAMEGQGDAWGETSYQQHVEEEDWAHWADEDSSDAYSVPSTEQARRIMARHDQREPRHTNGSSHGGRGQPRLRTADEELVFQEQMLEDARAAELARLLHSHHAAQTSYLSDSDLSSDDESDAWVHPWSVHGHDAVETATVAEMLAHALHGAVDVDAMGYEELLALGELIGPARHPGLTQAQVDTLPKLLYRRTTATTMAATWSGSAYEQQQQHASRRILTRAAVTTTQEAQDELTCTICLNEVQVGEEIRRLPCGHRFHSTSCVDVWLRTANTCPVCKAPPVPRDSVVTTNNSSSSSSISG